MYSVIKINTLTKFFLAFTSKVPKPIPGIIRPLFMVIPGTLAAMMLYEPKTQEIWRYKCLCSSN